MSKINGDGNGVVATGAKEDSIVKKFGLDSKVSVFPHPRDGFQTEEFPIVDFNDMPIQWLVTATCEALDTISYRGVTAPKTSLTQEGVSIEDQLTLSCKMALGFRLLDLNDKKCSNGRANVEYWSLLGPFLAAYGKVDRSDIGLRITPLPSVSLLTEMLVHGAIIVRKRDGDPIKVWEEIISTRTEEGDSESDIVRILMREVVAFSTPDWYLEMMRWLRTYKLMTNFGLPKDRFISNDDVYRLTTESDAIVGSEPRITADRMLIATIIRAASLANVFGQYRVGYGYITGVRSAIEDIALKALHINET